MVQVIGIAGAKGSGKTTSYEMISNMYGKVTERTLAGRIKEVCSEVFNVAPEHFEYQSLKNEYFTNPITLHESQVVDCIKGFDLEAGNVNKHIGKQLFTPRQILQYIGTEVLREIEEDIHIKYVMDNLPEDGICVITDVRFTNELEYIEQIENSLLIHLDNDKAEKAAEGDNHPSELERHSFKHRCVSVDNNGNLIDLSDNLKVALYLECIR